MRGHTHTRRGTTLVELMIAMTIGIILVMGMGVALILLFTGMRESRDFAEVTGRANMIRMMTFDARMGDELIFPATNGASGAYSSGGFEGHQVQFQALHYDPGTDTTSEHIITWESVRSTDARAGGLYTVNRWVDVGSGPELRFGQREITRFEIQRQSESNFTAELELEENGEDVAVSLSATLRNAR